MKKHMILAATLAAFLLASGPASAGLRATSTPDTTQLGTSNSADTEVLFDNAGTVDGNLNFTYNPTTGVLKSTVTDTDTSFSGTFDDLAKNGYFKNTINPGGSSSAITGAILGESIWTSSSGGSGAGHTIGIIGRTDFTGTGDMLWAIPVEGRCDNTGAGDEDSVTLTNCTPFAATFGTDTGSAGTISIGTAFYLGNMTDDSHVQNKFGVLIDDPDWVSIFDGGLQIEPVAGGIRQYVPGVGHQSSSRYMGPLGANDIAGLGAGGVAVTAGQMYCTKFMAYESGTLDSMISEVITDSGGDLRYCVYQDSAAGVPGVLIEDGGVVSVSSTGVKSDTLTATVKPGTYWGCFAVQGSGLTMDFDIVTNYHEIYGVDASRTAGEAAALATGVTGACPDPSGAAITASSTLTPGIGVSKN